MYKSLAMIRACFTLLLAMGPVLTFADSTKFADPGAAPVLPVSGVSSAGYVTVALAIVLAAVYGAAWVLRRFKTLHRGAQHTLDVVEAISIGPKERAVLIRVRDRQILLGVSPGQVNMLLDLGQVSPDTTPPVSPDAKVISGMPSFKALLRRSMGLS